MIHSNETARSRFMPWGLAIGAATLLLAAGCTGSNDASPGPPATAIPTRWPIKHVVFIIKENRSFDNLFGLFPGTNGTTTGLQGTKVVPLTRGVNVIPADLPHTYSNALTDWDHGAMDGFAQDASSAKYAYTEMHPDQIPNYWRWARSFVLADDFFASAMGPSFPNHLFTVAATSAGRPAGAASVPRS
jgi:phospholipase C